ncbi:MAG: T9SS type A sorting domain-containing protein [Bacteroidetes bacterium]|nr:T9SS type A sorting domain-containing protein [Bacteroidota bacterium]
MLHIFPNPVPKNSGLTVSTQHNSSGKWRIELRQTSGLVVFEWHFNAFEKEGFHIDLTGIPCGLYLLILYSQEEYGIQKVLIQ